MDAENGDKEVGENGHTKQNEFEEEVDFSPFVSSHEEGEESQNEEGMEHYSALPNSDSESESNFQIGYAEIVEETVHYLPSQLEDDKEEQFNPYSLPASITEQIRAYVLNEVATSSEQRQHKDQEKELKKKQEEEEEEKRKRLEEKEDIKEIKGSKTEVDYIRQQAPEIINKKAISQFDMKYKEEMTFTPSTSSNNFILTAESIREIKDIMKNIKLKGPIPKWAQFNVQDEKPQENKSKQMEDKK